VQGDLQAADEELSDLRLRMEVVESQIRDYLTGLSSSTASSVDVQFAEADLEEWNAIRSLVQERLIRLQTEREANDQIRELERATPPKVPVEELPYKLLALAAAAGMGFPMLLGLLLDLRSRRVDDAAQLEARSKLPVLAEIAAIPVRKQGKGAGDYRELKLFGESVDALSTSLILAQDLAQCRVFAITSALSGEGKTSVSCQLAVSISRSTGKRVLIIDGDLRSPDVHHVFNRPMTRGLAAVLAGEVDWHEVVDSGWSDHVHLLSAGRLKGSPHRLLTSGVFDDLIAQIRTEYEYIIIDTPPVLPASEALIFAKAADACLVSALRDRSRIDQLIQTYHRLQAAGANVAGSVLSGVPVREYAKYYGEYYHQST
jgi:capsular exopolysaccharide synthesis family protein